MPRSSPDAQLVNDRAICPSKDYPDGEIHERVPESETVCTQRISLNLLGDGFFARSLLCPAIRHYPGS
jgi:hypothetical protein